MFSGNLSVVPYSNSAEYRNSLRQMFGMDIPKMLLQLQHEYPDFDGFDEETRDELLFDHIAMENGMNYIYEHTNDCVEIQQLYLAAAGLMLSENPEIGLAVLMSYDYLFTFSKILLVFFSHGKENMGNNEELIKLQRILVTK